MSVELIPQKRRLYYATSGMRLWVFGCNSSTPLPKILNRQPAAAGPGWRRRAEWQSGWNPFLCVRLPGDFRARSSILLAGLRTKRDDQFLYPLRSWRIASEAYGVWVFRKAVREHFAYPRNVGAIVDTDDYTHIKQLI